jgi:signal transduction histidine kinase
VKAAPAEPFAAAALPLPALLDAATTKPSQHRIKLHGTALSGLLSGGFFLREDTRSVYVKTNQISPLQAGDEVEALGFAQMDVFSAILSDANFRVMAQGEAPTQRAVGAKELAIGECDAELISVDALILQNLEADNAFLVQVGKYPMKVICSQGKLPNADIGSAARFNGLCRVKGIKDEGYRASPTSYELWLRSPKDMTPISSAPWWTVRRLAYLVGVIGCIALLASAWIALLRRQVNKQLTMLQTKTQTEAIMEERQRIAREFHDTLEQELAGLSIRLDAVATRVSDDKARGLLEQQRRLLTRLQSETRDFVWDLRDTARTDLPLDEALSALLDHLRTNTEIPLQFKSEGPIKAMPALVQHHLLRIVREAVNNAIKYSKASRILISLDTQSDLLNLSVEDDGAGFDEQIANQLEGHFGIRGMKERARKMGADFNVCSSPGSGTSVELTLALTA